MPEPGSPTGFYEDPDDPRIVRYWTGTKWRDEAAEAQPLTGTWQRQAYEAANKTHWLFTSTSDTRPRKSDNSSQRDPRVHHPTITEASAAITGLLGTAACGVYAAAQAGASWGWIALVASPYALGGTLAVGAAAWAARKNKSS